MMSISGCTDQTPLAKHEADLLSDAAIPVVDADVGNRETDSNRWDLSVVPKEFDLDASTQQDRPKVTIHTDVTNSAAGQDSAARSLRLFLEEYGQDPASGPPLTDAQLHKNFTLLFLAYQPDMRARDLVKYLRHLLTEEQQLQAVEMVMNQDHKFQHLKRRRAEILENAFDGQSVVEQLRMIEEKTVRLSQELRSLVYTKVLTREQRAILAEQNKQKAAAIARLPAD